MPLAPSAEPGWSIVQSPNISDVVTLNELSGVACASSADCWAVGSTLFDGSYRTLTQHWDGISWKTVPSPNPSDTDHNHLFAVTCASANECWAVGYTDTAALRETLILRWNGSEWSLNGLPAEADSAGGFLTGVTCVSGSDCWAVGASVQTDIVNPATYRPLIARWNGVSWTVVPPPATGNSGHAFLYAATCSSASDCWAVGYQGGSPWQTLVLHWNGTSWTVVASPNSSTTQNNFLFGVSCGSAGVCSAVGVYTVTEEDLDRTLVLQWDGAAWTVVDSPNGDATRHSSLYGVSCASASDCQAVGYGYFAGSAYWQTLILRWNGSSWAIAPSASSSTTQHNILYGIACAGASDCWGVGTYEPGSTEQTLTERWNGASWAIVDSPNASGKQRNQLFGVACVSASDCWAVGVYRGPANDQTLIMRWNGVLWTIVPSPNAGVSKKNVLTSVTCVSASDCWAVGQHTPGLNDQTLTLHWDGTSWSIAASPNISATKPHQLNDVTCTSASNCWAVGEYLNPSFSLETLTMRWDGSSWAFVTSPNIAGQRNVLMGVTCLSAGDCWAVGFTDTAEGYRTLIERWNGTSWSIAISENVPTRPGVLSAVACNSSTDCWAVGNYNNSLAEQTLIERWDGTSWTITPSPNTVATSYNYLSDVSCVSPTECWAVGYAFTVGSPQTVTLRWDGVSWTRITSPNTGETHDNYLSKIACVPSSDCMAAGYYLTTQTGTAQTLTLRFPGVQLLSVASRKSHGGAGDFDLNLPFSAPLAVECRSGGASGDYTMVFTFATDLSSVGSASVTAGTGTISSSAIGSDAHQYVVNLTGVTNAQLITVTLSDVTDSQGNSSNAVSASMGVLLADTTGNGSVNSSDISQTKSQSGQAVSASNFRQDVTVNGSINSSDISLVKSQSGTALSTAP